MSVFHCQKHSGHLQEKEHYQSFFFFLKRSSSFFTNYPCHTLPTASLLSHQLKQLSASAAHRNKI